MVVLGQILSIIPAVKFIAKSMHNKISELGLWLDMTMCSMLFDCCNVSNQVTMIFTRKHWCQLKNTRNRELRKSAEIPDKAWAPSNSPYKYVAAYV